MLKLVAVDVDLREDGKYTVRQLYTDRAGLARLRARGIGSTFLEAFQEANQNAYDLSEQQGVELQLSYPTE